MQIGGKSNSSSVPRLLNLRLNDLQWVVLLVGLGLLERWVR